MKQIALLAAAVLALCASAPASAVNHRLSYGFRGDVKQADIIRYHVVMNDGELQFTEPDEVVDTVSILFDRQGRFLRDHMHNAYTWDSKGNFIEGSYPYSAITCDDKGRVVEYRNFDPLTGGESETDYKITYTYDNDGRLVKEVLTSSVQWFEITFIYDANGYLIGEKCSGDDEGSGKWASDFDIDVMETDDRGNWTVRMLSITTVETVDETGKTLSSTSYSVERCEYVYF